MIAENRILAGTGFRDTTRIAAGDPDLWTGILAQNAEHIGDGIAELQARLAAFREALRAQDSSRIHELLHEGQISRKALDQAPRHPE
jgi:prephenate dehydrogenase